MQTRIVPAHAAHEYYFEEGCYIRESSNGVWDEELSVAHARVPPAATTRWHRLHGIGERYVILAGRGRVEVGELAPQEVGPGDVVVIPPGTRQRIASLGPGDLTFLAICTPRFVPQAYEALGGE